jgi:hypothetical protein
MTRAPVVHFAIGLEMSREMNDPTKPNTNENTSKAVTTRPVPVKKRPTPNTFKTIESTRITARFVARNNSTLFIPESSAG